MGKGLRAGRVGYLFDGLVPAVGEADELQLGREHSGHVLELVADLLFFHLFLEAFWRRAALFLGFLAVVLAVVLAGVLFVLFLDDNFVRVHLVDRIGDLRCGRCLINVHALTSLLLLLLLRPSLGLRCG